MKPHEKPDDEQEIRAPSVAKWDGREQGPADRRPRCCSLMADDVVLFWCPVSRSMRKADFAAGGAAPPVEVVLRLRSTVRARSKRSRSSATGRSCGASSTVVVTPPGGAPMKARRPYPDDLPEAGRQVAAGARRQSARAGAGGVTVGGLRMAEIDDEQVGSRAAAIARLCRPWSICQALASWLHPAGHDVEAARVPSRRSAGHLRHGDHGTDPGRKTPVFSICSFAELRPDEAVVFRGSFVKRRPRNVAAPMQLTFSLADEDGGTKITLHHEGLPGKRFSVEDNQRGLRIVAGQAGAALVERRQERE